MIRHNSAVDRHKNATRICGYILNIQQITLMNLLCPAAALERVVSKDDISLVPLLQLIVADDRLSAFTAVREPHAGWLQWGGLLSLEISRYRRISLWNDSSCNRRIRIFELSKLCGHCWVSLGLLLNAQTISVVIGKTEVVFRTEQGILGLLEMVQFRNPLT